MLHSSTDTEKLIMSSATSFKEITSQQKQGYQQQKALEISCVTSNINYKVIQ